MSAEEWASLPTLTASNFNGKFKDGKVAFDNVDGMGAMPDNQEVDYLGFGVELKPSQFLRLVPHQDRADYVKRIKGFVQRGGSHRLADAVRAG